MLYSLFFFLALLLAKEYVVHMPGKTLSESRLALANTDLTLQRAVGTPGWFVIEAPDTESEEEHAHLHGLRSSGDVHAMAPLVDLDRRTRTEDPWMRDAWYITGTSHFGSPVSITNNASHVWNDYDGKGVAICIIDDAVSTTHKELSHAFDSKRSRAMCGSDSVDPPTSSYKHGTAAAAVAVGAFDNGVCGAGVAPGATLGVVRLLSCRMNDANEATAVSFKCDAPKNERNDIYSMSWGPYDDGKHVDGPGIATEAAIEHCIANGRDGKGSIYVVAGGNGARQRDNAGWDGYASSIYTIAVGAIANDGVAAWYSEWGSGLLVSVGSSGGSNTPYSGIGTATFSTYDTEKCDWFGGTSAACPQVAGLIAILLQRRPDLTWRDVQNVLVHSGVVVDPSNSVHPWVTNAAGLTHSNQYGFGLVSANNMLRVAEDYQLMGSWKHYCSSPRDAHHSSIDSGDRAEFSMAITTRLTKIEHVLLHVDMAFDGSLSDLGRIRLTSPSGTTSLLTGSNRQPHNSLNWSFDTVRFWGERPNGAWGILLENTGRSAFYLNSVSICVYGE